MFAYLNLHAENALGYVKRKKEALASEFKGDDGTTVLDSASTILDVEEETPVVIDTYTHKEDIPSLKSEKIKEVPKDDFEITVPQEEEQIEMKVETVTKEPEEKKNLADKLVDDFGEFDPTLELAKYKFPSIDLLDAHGVDGGITINQEELEENKNKIVETLKNYKIGIAQIKATIGPTVTLYEIVPEAGVRISKIKNLEDDIALSLAALGIRIIAPIPGKGTIGIEVPIKNPTIVSMRSVIASSKFSKAEMQLSQLLLAKQ